MKRSVTFKYALFQGCYWASSVLIYGYTRVFLMNYGCSATTAGVVMAIGSLAAAFLQPLMGAIMHRKSISLRTVLFTVTALGLVSSLIMLAPLPAPAVVAFFTLLTVMTNSAMGFLNASGFALQKEGEKLNFSAARAVGSVTYAAVSKLMSSLSSANGMLACQISCAAALAALALTLLPRHDREQEQAEAATAAEAESGFFARNRNYILMLVGQAMIFFMHHIITGFLFDITSDLCHGTEAQMGTAISLGAFFEMPGMLIAGRFMKKRSPARLLQVSAVMYALRTGLFLLFPSMPMLYALEIMQMITFSFLIPVFPVFVEQYVAPGDRLRCQTLNTGASAAAGFLGFLVGGILVDSYGILFTLRLALGVCVPGSVLLFVFAGRAASGKRL